MGTAETYLLDEIRRRYGAAANQATSGETACCGEPGGCCGPDPISSDLYATGETAGVPATAVRSSLGCGNPTALAELRAGEVVLDLGSGGGLDVLLSARRVAPTGKAYGLDTTPEMLALARRNQEEAGVANAEFLEGRIEAIPLPDASVDVIISNCVINLAADKDQVLREAFRVLRPGGRFAVSDVVVEGELPEAVRQNLALWTGCVAGALEVEDYRAKLATAGFVDVTLEPTRIYGAEEASALLAGAGVSDPGLEQHMDGRVLSAFIRARKPEPAA